MSDGQAVNEGSCTHGWTHGRCPWPKCPSNPNPELKAWTTEVGVLEAVLPLLKRHGVAMFKTPDFELSFFMPAYSAPVTPVVDEPLAPTAEAIGMEAGKPTDDEMLFWSSPAGPVNITAEKPEE